ncbi:hypothetical protein [Aureimonas leprariae]|uniref:Uncharacterized protein n=1 Tax=Plantimonas leprariae TaxID=2615207 RepID=A0A7V7PSA5_9HYPH|nr:hypothetical protein [Aureimonas leprariae]KAB0682003.1 hypothetical protein F6X38_04140 [Aureimonas leprariae]
MEIEMVDTVETMVIVAKGSDGKVHDLHRVVHRSRSKASGPDAPWTDHRVVWLTSTGVVAETEDEATFFIAEGNLTLTKLTEIPTVD